MKWTKEPKKEFHQKEEHQCVFKWNSQNKIKKIGKIENNGAKETLEKFKYISTLYSRNWVVKRKIKEMFVIKLKVVDSEVIVKP